MDHGIRAFCHDRQVCLHGFGKSVNIARFKHTAHSHFGQRRVIEYDLSTRITIQAVNRFGKLFVTKDDLALAPRRRRLDVGFRKKRGSAIVRTTELLWTSRQVGNAYTTVT